MSFGFLWLVGFVMSRFLHNFVSVFFIYICLSVLLCLLRLYFCL